MTENVSSLLSLRMRTGGGTLSNQSRELRFMGRGGDISIHDSTYVMDRELEMTPAGVVQTPPHGNGVFFF